jgi:hypothetical protein
MTQRVRSILAPSGALVRRRTTERFVAGGRFAVASGWPVSVYASCPWGPPAARRTARR